MGFSCKWSVSLTKGADVQERAASRLLKFRD